MQVVKLTALWAVIDPRLTNLYPAVLVACSANQHIMEVPVSAVLDTKVLFVQNVSAKLYCFNWLLLAFKSFL